MKRTIKGLKPSALIRVALEDEEKVHNDKRYVVNMDDWHIPLSSGNVCSVCFAGAVMAMSLDVAHEKLIGPYGLNESQELRALNAFRLGEVKSALDMLDIENEGIEDMDVTFYETNRNEFRSDMEKMAVMLEGYGL